MAYPYNPPRQVEQNYVLTHQRGDQSGNVTPAVNLAVDKYVSKP
jgi:hypothetical protein